MRILALTAAVLFGIAAGEARAFTTDPGCKLGVGTAEQRINAAIQMNASYTSPTVQRLRYQMHMNGAYIYLNCAGDFDSALAILGRATKLKPTEPTAFAGRALLFSEKGDFKSAHAEMAKAQ